MRTLKTRAAVAATTGALALAGILGTAGTASAAPAAAASAQRTEVTEAGDAQATLALYNRKVWKTVNHRAAPDGDSTLIGRLYAGTYYTVSCWRYGETVTAEGTTNNVWIFSKNGSGRWGYASAIYFSGNKYADLPLTARC
ncbi:SH3 domain-containing protein [Streptomyces sp. NPDC058326]|uniref:SH3 domain-containing protein n=1 Tax=Streptomyces sp. NPDC058326 TaxID=3346447 RepID=UPI0036EECB9D